MEVRPPARAPTAVAPLGRANRSADCPARSGAGLHLPCCPATRWPEQQKQAAIHYGRVIAGQSTAVTAADRITEWVLAAVMGRLGAGVRLQVATTRRTLQDCTLKLKQVGPWPRVALPAWARLRTSAGCSPGASKDSPRTEAAAGCPVVKQGTCPPAAGSRSGRSSRPRRGPPTRRRPPGWRSGASCCGSCSWTRH